MKTLCRLWPALCLGLLAGCTSSAADQSEPVSERPATVQPEWARDAAESTVVVAAKVQPIPDGNDDSPSTSPVVKPIPDDINP